MSDSGDGGGSSKNKRKHLSESPGDTIDLSTLSLTEFPRYEEKLQNSPKESDTISPEGELEEWNDPVCYQLLDLLSDNLRETLQSAIKKIAESGYCKEFAEKLILRSGLYHGTKDVVANAVDGAFAFMREKESVTSKYHVFPNLENLVDFSLVEMINVVREVKPCSSVPEAMWLLLICDLNLWHALAVQRDHLGSFYPQDCPGESLTDSTDSQSKPESPKTSHSNLNKLHLSKPMALRGQCSHSENPTIGTGIQRSREHAQTATQTAVMEEKSGGSRKGLSGNLKRDMLRQKTFHFEKSYKGRMSKGAFKAKLTTWGSMILEKQLKARSSSSGVAMKTADNPDVLAAGDTVFALPAVSDKAPSSLALESNPTSETEAKNAGLSEVPDYYSGILYDESLGKYVPRDDKEETILGLVSEMKALEKEIQLWNDWANEKVMQATRRLTKDQTELKMLRQEKEEVEKFKIEKPSNEESTLKRLSEMENALNNTTVQIDKANLALHRLEKESSVLNRDAEAEKLKAQQAMANLQEALRREQETSKKYLVEEKMKVSLQEELTALKHIKDGLLQQVQKAEGRKKQLESLQQQEEGEKLNIHEQAECKRRETEQQKARTKSEEDKMREAAESKAQKCTEVIRKLENEISELRLVSESPRIAALLGGVGIGYASSLGNKAASGWQQFPVPKANKRLAVFQDNFGAESVKPERECVMCLSEEMSVVFFPCAHQVLCSDCNVLHEKEGMSDCPSCRTPIQERIRVRFMEPQRS